MAPDALHFIVTDELTLGPRPDINRVSPVKTPTSQRGIIHGGRSFQPHASSRLEVLSAIETRRCGNVALGELHLVSLSSIPEWLHDYTKRGFQLVFYPAKLKGPVGREALEWQHKDYTPRDYRPGLNVGVKLGTEVEPGRYLVDVDLDWAPGLVLAKRLLPAAGFGFGRNGRITHAFYTTDQPLRARAFKDIIKDNKERGLVELRARKVDGSVGLQTMLPPSTHPSGDILEMRTGGPITFEPNIERSVILYAIGCLFLINLGDHGFTHNIRVGFAGLLLQMGLEEEEVVLIGEALATATGNNVQDVGQSVRSTALKYRTGDRIIGKKALFDLFGKKDGGAIVQRIRQWLGGSDFIANDKDQIYANNQTNIRTALEKLTVTLSHDTFSERNMVLWDDYNGPLNDKVRNRLWLKIDETFHFRPSPDFFDVVLEDTCMQNEYHPVLQYLNVLVWDNKPRIDTWIIDYAGAIDTPYVRAVSRLVLIAAVKRVRNPGCKFDELLILESPQGMLKSSALRALCPNESWFSDDLPLNIDSKEVIERTNGKWIIEAAELSGLHKSQTEHLKSFLSRAVDGPVRMAYAHMPIERHRQFIIVGTTNSQSYLKDRTGNRRFWPVTVKKFNIMGLTMARDQLWAEAAQVEAEGAPARLDEKLYTNAEQEQQDRVVEDTWHRILEARFIDDKQYRITIHEVLEELGIPVSNQDDKTSERVATILQSLGFRRMTIRDKEKRVVKGWGREPKQGELK